MNKFKFEIILLFQLLCGCGGSASPIYFEDGSKGYSVECKTEHQCMTRISNQCDRAGFDIVSRSRYGKKESIMFVCGR